VLAANHWHTNAALILDVVKLGYLRSEWHTLDPTWGRGLWWTLWRPDSLVRHDKYTLDDVDFTFLPEPDETFDAVAFDPPYVCMGGRKTTTIPEFYDRFGLFDAPKSPALLQELIDAGLAEMHRVVKHKGIVLVKCKDYVSSGKLFLGTHHTLTAALNLGFECLDRFEYIARQSGVQSQAAQVHARRNLSTLFVLRRG
jgi:tRNA G10  N-methylase Trm11